jgi:hypothetical protein
VRATVYLVLSADGRAVVHLKQRPLRPDQVGIPIRVQWPTGWGAYRAAVDVSMPEPPDVTVGEPLERQTD